MCSLITCDVCHKLTWSGCGQDIQLHSKELMKEVNPGDRCTCGEKKRFPRPLSKLSRPIEAIRQFTPSWFSMTMGTGILSVLLQVFPFQFNGLHTIAVIIFVLNVVIYCTFTIMTVARYVMFPSVLSLMLNHSAQSLFIGTMPMGLTTIINFIIVGLPQHFDWALDLAFVLWCIDLAFTLICCIGVPYFIIVHHNHQIESMNGTWLLPIVPAVVHSASGGLLANHIDENRAFVVLIISYLLMGMGILLAISIIVIYFYRLAVHKLPPKEVIISVFLPLGPLGQGAYGMVQLGAAGQRLFGDKYFPGLGSVVHGIGLVLAFFLWGYGFWYLIIAILSVATTHKKQGIPFNMGWWGLTFPIGVYTAGTFAIGDTLDSMAFHVFGAILTVVLVIIWLSIMAKTIVGAWSGEMFSAPCLTPVVLRQ